MVDGVLDGTTVRLGIAVATWNRAITDRLLEGALARCDSLGVADLTVLRVPGALELPLAAMKLAEAGCDAVVAIGAVIKGETDHYEIVVRESSAGLRDVSLSSGVPVANAILAVHDIEDALERSIPGPANKGEEAVDAAILTVNAFRGL